MSLTVVWAAAAVQKTTVGEDGKTVSEEVILKRGDTLPDYVSDFQRSVMVMVGAARDLGQAVEVVQAAVDAVTADMEPTPSPAVPPEVPVAEPNTGATADVADVEDGPVLPKDTDTRAVWEDYGVYSLPEGNRLTTEEATAFPNKAELIAAVKQRAA